MAWTWRLEDADGTTMDVAQVPQFGVQSSQADAESWLGESWRELREAGVARVALMDGTSEVYAMSLSDEAQ